ncbi:MAG: outer membrane beta-barrel protein [Flavobacteriales bacterium]|nr:outer membrane beta-barrel protein [Flavobacteriales bacterium]MCB9168146.1 outer membrane beta-barrel protein [Flavobacteriales bacterium]MCB9194289.1 outer membrane beta-barrel protein [Flavobacteriales bacterium]
MKKLLFFLGCMGTSIMGLAQLQLNPQIGTTYQHLTPTDQNVTFKGAIGWQFGVDARMGNRVFLQPGIFIGRNVTAMTTNLSDTIQYENDLVRTALKLKALVGVRIVDSYQFDLRFVAGPTYDVLLSTDVKGDDRISWNGGDFSKGSFNIDAGLGFDMGLVTLEPSISFGLTRVMNDNITVRDIDSRYLTYGLTLGINFGDDDRRDHNAGR